MCSAPDPNTLTTTVTQRLSSLLTSPGSARVWGLVPGWVQSDPERGWGSRAGWVRTRFTKDPSLPAPPLVSAPHQPPSFPMGSSLDKVVHLWGWETEAQKGRLSPLCDPNPPGDPPTCLQSASSESWGAAHDFNSFWIKHSTRFAASCLVGSEEMQYELSAEMGADTASL